MGIAVGICVGTGVSSQMGPKVGCCASVDV